MAAGSSVRDCTKPVHSLGIDLSFTEGERKDKEEVEKLMVFYDELGSCKLGVQRRIHPKPNTVPIKQHLRVGFRLHKKRM